MTDRTPDDRTPDLSWIPARPAPLDDDAALAAVDAVIAAGPFDATWASLVTHETPLWYRDAKFGVFIHWGVFSVPAIGDEWYSRWMYIAGTEAFAHHRATYGDQSVVGYKDFIPDFHMADFDPDDWVALFRRAGIQFIVPTMEHHDGFAMYDTARSRWKASAMGPKRDVFGDLAAAARRGWLTVGGSSHRAEHWFFMNGGSRFDSDVLDPRFADFYGPAQREETAPNAQYLEDWLLRTTEFIDRYRPQVLWFDWWIEQPAFEPYRRRVAAYYYNRLHQRGREGVIVYKWDAFAEGSATYAIERGAMFGPRADVWESDTAVSRTSWSWTRSHDYKTLNDLVSELVDTVSKNGTMLLNIGPKPDGTIPDAERELLRGMGDWLSVHGAAIYGSRPWTIAGEGPTPVHSGSFADATSPVNTPEDIRFTSRHDVTGDYLYAILLAPGDVARIRAWGTGSGLLGRGIRHVRVLGHTGECRWASASEYLEVTVGPELTIGASARVVELFLEPEATAPRTDYLHG